MKIKCLIWLACLFYPSLYAQNSWTGDTGAFIITSETIQLNAEAISSEKTIFTPSEAINNASWETAVEMQFNPSSSNYCRIYLACDQNNMATLQNGYFVECGSTDDDLKLFKLNHGEEILLIDGKDKRLDKAQNNFQIKVTKDKYGRFSLYYRDESISEYIPEGSVADRSVIRSNFFALQCTYTSTRSKLFSFSDIAISGEAHMDSIAPKIDSAFAYNSHTIYTYFDEPVFIGDAIVKVNNNVINASQLFNFNNLLMVQSSEKLNSLNTISLEHIKDKNGNSFSGYLQLKYIPAVIEYAEITDSQTVLVKCNYKPDFNLIYPEQFSLGAHEVEPAPGPDAHSIVLRSMQSLMPDKKYYFSVNQLVLQNGDTIPQYETILSYHIPVMFDVVISEIMADPTPSLAYSSEYIELYNRSDYAIDIAGWILKVNSNAFEIPNKLLSSKSSLVFSEHYTGAYNQISSSKFPGIPNDACTIELIDDKGKTIDYMAYRKDYHEEPFKQEGGWSLERVDANNFQTKDNWQSCIRNDGGTPGQQNSVAMDNPDIEPPYISNIFPGTNNIDISFSEPIQNLNAQEIDVGVGIKSMIPRAAQTRWEITTGTNLAIGQTCQVQLSKVSDFNGNLMNGIYRIALPEKPEPDDLIINELMIDPLDNEPEYIELYNKSDKYINAGNLRLTRRNDDGFLEALILISTNDYLIPPHAYLVVSEFELAAFGNEFPKINYVTSKLYNLSNENGNVVLCTETGFILDEINYDENWHLSSLIDTRGISLERICPDQPTDKSSNWTSAGISPLYSTPGYCNTQFMAIETIQEALFSISKDYFTPNGDGENDVLLFQVQHENKYTLSLKIYDHSGCLIRTICNGHPGINQSVLNWDGCDENGRLCQSGIYVIHFHLISDTKTETIKKAVTLSR